MTSTYLIARNFSCLTHVTVDMCNYKLEKDDLCVSELRFEMLDSVKVEIGILDWGIKMIIVAGGWYVRLVWTWTCTC